MQFYLSDPTLRTWQGDCAVIYGFSTPNSDEDPATLFALPSELAELDQQAWGGALSELIQEQGFQGKGGSIVATRIGADIRKIILVGLGDPGQLTLEGIRRATAMGLRQANQLKAKQVALVLPESSQDLALTIQAAVEGGLLVAHQDTRFKSQAKQQESKSGFSVEGITLILPIPIGEHQAHYETMIRQAEMIVEGAILARELVSAPANVVTPVTLAETARQIAAEQGLDVEVLGQAECEALGMGAFLGVAQASDLPPQFIHLTYKPAGAPVRKLALIGKGLTFDSGGLNIKTDSKSIAMMKTDMGGAAAVLGAARSIGALKPNLEVHFIVAATENMISGRAIHPGDILTASNQKTIEINNTDAEGRLTLADALVFAEKLEVDTIIDLATLTGACVVALGDEIAGLFTPSDDLATQIQAASQISGEKFWRMPMEDSYFESMNSVVADMKNAGPRPGGAITAALFLKQFVNSTHWAHLDIAGPVWSDRESGYLNKGGTGFGVRTLVEFVLMQASEQAVV